MAQLDSLPKVLALISAQILSVTILLDKIRNDRVWEKIFYQYGMQVLDYVLASTYPKYADIIKDIVTAASCYGKLDYRFEGPRRDLTYLVPLECSPWDLKTMTPVRLLNTLEIVVEVVKEAEELARILIELSGVNYMCRCGKYSAYQGRRGVLMNVFQIQLCVARLFNVRIETQPDFFHDEGMVLDDESRNVDFCALYRKKAAAIMEGQVGSQCSECLQRMWEVLDALEGRFITLRRHRLRPRHGSLMDLLFNYPGNDIFWSLNPTHSVWRLLIDKHGVNMGETIRCKTPQHMFVLRQSDTEHFDAFLVVDSGDLFEDAKPFLEQFRPLLGLCYNDQTPVWQLLGQSISTSDDIGCRCNDHEPATKSESTLDEVLANFGNEDRGDVDALRVNLWNMHRLPPGFTSMHVLDRAVDRLLQDSANLLYSGIGYAGFAG
jgi:hypothetical protein